MKKKSLKEILSVTFTVFLLAASLLTMAGCGTDTQGTDDPAEGNKSGLDLIGGGMANVYQQNMLSAHLADAEAVKVSFDYGEKEESTYYFKDGEGAGTLTLVQGADGNMERWGTVRCMDFYEDEGSIKGYMYMDQYAEHGVSLLSEAIATLIDTGAVIDEVKDMGDTVEVTATGENAMYETEETQTYTLEKDTLKIKKLCIKDDMGNETNITVEPATDEDKNLIQDFMAAWDKTRTLNFVLLQSDIDGNDVKTETDVEVPVNWQVTPEYGFTTYKYLNENLTKEYSYPGDGKAYTIYSTTAAG